MSEPIIPMGLFLATSKRFAKPFLEEFRKERAEKIIHAFVQAYSELIENKTAVTIEKTNVELEKLFRDEKKSKFFKASVRRAYNSISEDLGPVIQMFLMADILAKDRDIEYIDELIFEACDSLNDKYILEFCDYLNGQIKENNGLPEVEFYITLHSEEFIDAKKATEVFDLVEFLDLWAFKAEQAGLIRKYTKTSIKDMRDENENVIEGKVVDYCISIFGRLKLFIDLKDKAEGFLEYYKT